MTSTETQPKRRRRRSRDEIVARIIAAATDEFKQYGYSDATTSRIAKKAGITETQLFRYYDKATLFRETIFDPIGRHFSEFVAKHLSVDELEVAYTTDLHRFLRENIELITSLVVVEIYGGGQTQGVGEVDSLRTYFERGEDALWKVAAKSPKVAPRLMVRVSFVAVLACIMFEKWIFPPGFATRDEITSAIRDFVLEGSHAVRQGRDDT